MNQELRNERYRDIERECAWCKQMYKAWRYNKNPLQYCGVSCSIRARRLSSNSIERTCLACHTSFVTWQSQPRKFCSKQCANTQRGNKSKWYTVQGTRCQGLYEVAFALWAHEHSLELQAHVGCLRWLANDGKSHRYFPDFWVPSWNCYVEVKSSWIASQHPEKLQKIHEQNADIEIRLLTEKELEELGIDVSRNTLYRLRRQLRENPDVFAKKEKK